jgi:hypothetical protein
MLDTMKTRLRQSFSHSSRRLTAQPTVYLRLEALEDRIAPATWPVTSTADSGPGTLRAQLAAAANGDVISFNIPRTGVQVISLQSALDPINVSVRIDGTTQPGYTGVQPLIELDGGAAVPGDGLTLAAANSEVRGLSVVNFTSGAGVKIGSATGNSIVDACFLGLDPSGVVVGNDFGVQIVNSPWNTIGAVPGVAGVAGNVISGNLINGVRIEGAASTHNTVASNHIGTDPLGLVAKRNVSDGVLLRDGAAQNTIGGDLSTDGNLISGNGRAGVHLDLRSSGNYVEGNDIGLNVNGNAKLPNGDGVLVEDAAANNVIGGGHGQSIDFGNIISGNTGDGVRLNYIPGTPPPFGPPTGTKILGNYIGLGSDGSTALGNGADGVRVSGATNTLIGSGNATEGNVISANGQDGIEDNDSGTQIFGNLIGTDATGLLANRGNQKNGIEIGANQTQVGQSGVNSRNIISGNKQYGIDITGGSQNYVQNNYIGLGSNGDTPIANQQGGVIVEGNATQTKIGGDSSDLGNVISGNTATNVGPLFGNGIVLRNGTSDTLVAGNLIGTDYSGQVDRPNAGDGIYIEAGSTNNILGWQSAYNLISGNTGFGIEEDAANDYIDWNFIGLDAHGFPMANVKGPWLNDGNSTFGPDNFHN